MSQTPAGWYPDGSGQLRYWDGFQWTDHTAPLVDANPVPTSANANAYAGSAGSPTFDNYGTYAQTNAYVNNAPARTNGIGTSGFVLALLAALLSWTPIVGSVLWVLGAVLSVIGAFRQPRGLAIAGIVISFLGLILLILFLTVLAGLSILIW